jgi:hypothetical protein
MNSTAHKYGFPKAAVGSNPGKSSGFGQLAMMAIESINVKKLKNNRYDTFNNANNKEFTINQMSLACESLEPDFRILIANDDNF